MSSISPLTPLLSWSVTVSCWFHGVAMATPVCDRCPSRANELCVVSHAYRLNGKSRALVRGSTGVTRVQRGRTLPSATQVSQCSPASQLRSSAHVSPTFRADTTAAGAHDKRTTTAASRRRGRRR
uniref:Secreted protein n=1 Tax=Arundo donax TaxID=35708 RepID=A0A0A9BRZ4_ARUDO